MQGLVLQDLKMAAGAIELGATRGAYRANEMKLIGETYERLTAFIRSAEPPADAADAETEASTTEANAGEVTETSEDTASAS
jgi:cytochrome c556